MNSTSGSLRAGYAGLALLDSWLAGRPPHRRRARLLTKPLLMPMLAGSLLTDPRARDARLRRSTLLAQAGAWGGDVALLGAGTRPFLAGVGLFAAGHLGSLAGMRRLAGPTPLRQTPGGRVAAGIWLTTAPVLAYAVARRGPVLVAPVLAYAALLATLAARASHLDPDLPVDARRRAAAGAWTFLVSDTLLATRTFVLAAPNPGLDRAVMLTYTSAQLLLSEAATRA